MVPYGGPFALVEEIRALLSRTPTP
jgi:hypothetical protein